MEVFVHIIKDLNRYLNLGLYILFDQDRILVNSLNYGINLLEFNSAQTIDLYNALQDLKQKITSWDLKNSTGKNTLASVVRGQIYNNYKFDIVKHYQISKYGCK